jgi:phospholipid-binding lipoprotein MlaA
MHLSRHILLLLFTLSLPHAIAADEPKNIDPLESINRPLFALNDGLDMFVIRPLAIGYDFILPNFAKRGMGNFFANMWDANAAVNSVLQGRLPGAAQGAGRFLINSTFGLLGFVDVATPMGIRPNRTDFGHTLATWGLPAGPYIMVPFFGPRTFRSGAGTIFDSYVSIQANTGSVAIRNTLWGLEVIDYRSRYLLADELISGDRYIFVRDAYLQQREIYINDGVVIDTFSDYEEADWDDDF